jgi:anti-sigma factor (TIGR02949 family)
MSWVDDLRRLLSRMKQQPPMDPAPGGIPCEVAMDHLFEWLDGEVEDPDLEAKVGVHLETCARCYPLLTFERSFREALKRVADGERTPEEVRARILKSLESEGFKRS